MTNFTDNEIHTILQALASQATTQRELAETCDADENAAPILAESLRKGERESQALRARFAAEMHRRGRTDCDLAHPGRPCPHGRKEAA